MSIRKDKSSGIWQIAISPPGGGARIRCSAGTTDKQAAAEYHDRLKADLWRQAKLGDRPEKQFEDAAVQLLSQSAGQRDYATKLLHVEYWREQFAGRTLRSLTAGEIVEHLPTHRTYQRNPPRPLANGSKNKYLATIRRMLNIAVELDWLDKCPKLPRYEEPDIRVRWEPPHRIIALIEAMSLPWMQDAAIVAVASGMREDELFSVQPLTVNLADRSTWIEHETAKSKRARSVPLNDDAFQVIERRMQTAQCWVFTRDNGDGRKIGQHDRRVFQRACEIVGIEDFHWHDLRHTWASWHVQHGTPLMVLKELGGWETIEMVQKYAHLAPSHLAAHANAVKILTKLDEEEKTPPERAALVA